MHDQAKYLRDPGDRPAGKSRVTLRTSRRAFYAITTSTAALLAGIRPSFGANGTWTAASSGNWNTTTNWASGTIPGATVAITGTNANADTATFNSSTAVTVTVDNAAENIKNIAFDTAAAGGFTIANTSGTQLFLSSGGMLQIASTLTASVGNYNISTPLYIEGTNGTYTFANNRAAAGVSLMLNGSIAGNASGNTLVTLGGSSTPTMSFANGVISNGSATSLGLNQSGANWSYTAANTYTGATQILSGTANLTGANGALTNTSGINVFVGGTLKYDNSTVIDASRLAAAASLTLDGGTLNYVAISTGMGNASAGSVHLLAFNASQTSFLTTTNASTGNTSTLTIGSISVGSHATLAATLPGADTASGTVAVTTAPTMVNSILPWSTELTNGSFLTVNGSSDLVAYGNVTGSWVTSWGGNTNTSNVKLTSAPAQLSANNSVNALNYTGSGTIDMGTHTLTINSGGLILNNALAVIADGSITTGAGNQDLYVHTLNNATITTLITDNGSPVSVSKDGTGTLTISGVEPYTGQTTLGQGNLIFGFTGSGASSLNGPLVGATGTTISRASGSGQLTLNTLNTPGTFSDNSTNGVASPTIITQSGTGLTIGTISGAAGSVINLNGTGSTTINSPLNSTGQTIVFNGGNWTLLGNGAYGSSLMVNTGATVQTGVGNSQNFFNVASLNIAGGSMTFQDQYGLRMGSTYGSNSGATTNVAATQNGGVLNVANDFELGGNSGTYSAYYNLTGGTLSTTVNVNLGANATSGGQTTLALTGGKLITSATVQGLQGAGALQAFVWTGGELAASAYNATNLTSSVGTPVGSTTNTLTNAGGILAPGDIGTTGRTTITGNYSVTTPSASLAIDINGTSGSSSFQDSGSGYYDNLTVSGSASIGGLLRFNVISGYTPANNTTTLYKILTGSSAGITGTFVNQMTAGIGKSRVVGADGLSSFLIAINNTASTATVGGLTSVPAYAMALGGYQTSNSYISASGGSWDAANAASWSNFDPGSTASPATQASGAIARFADGGSTGTGANIVNLNSTRNIQGMQFASGVAGHNYTINTAGGGSIFFDNTANALPAVISDSSVSGNMNAISVPISLNSNLSLTVANAANILTLSGGISGTGKSLALTGPGTLALGASNYTGGTVVNSGTLSAVNTTGSATGTGTVTLNGGTLASGTIGTISGAILAGTGSYIINPGGAGAFGTLSLGSTLALNGVSSTLTFDVSNSTSDLLAVTGALSIAGKPNLAIDPAGTLTGVSYTLATFANSGSLSPAGFNISGVPTGYTILATPTSLKLISTANNSALNFSTGTLSFGRVIMDQTPSVTATLVNSGTMAGNYSSGVSDNGITVPATGTANAGSNSIVISLADNTNGSASLGPRSWTYNISNTTNAGDLSSPQSVSLSATVVSDRLITATPLAFGLLHAGATASGSTTLTTTGDSQHFTSVINSGVVFNSSASTTTTTISPSFSTPGAISSSVDLPTTSAENGGSGLVGESDIDVLVPYTAQVYSGQATYSGPATGSWSVSSNWTDVTSNLVGGVPGVTGFAGDTATLGKTTGPVSVTLDSAAPSIAALTFNSSGGYALVQGNASNGLTLSSTSGVASINVITGSHSLAVPVTLASRTAITTAASSVLSIASAVSGSGLLAVNGSGQVIVSPAGSLGVPVLVNGSLTLANNSAGSGYLQRNIPSLNLSAGASVTVASISNRLLRQVLVLGNLEFGGTSGNWAGSLNLGNNDLVVQDGNAASLTSQVAQGYNSGGAIWNSGTGIKSLAAANDTAHLTALGVIQNSATGLPGGPVVRTTFDNYNSSSSDVLIKYTYYGDANLSGNVDSADYTLIDNGYLNQLSGWYNGDFNYDGLVNGSDYTLIDNAFNVQGAQLSAQVAISTAQINPEVSSVPEPVGLGGFVAVAALLRRRRRIVTAKLGAIC
jgi:autotransporter-associated beta strand protein